MESKDYLAYLVEKIHTTVVATVDDAGLPVTAAIDMMDADEGDVYFLTARGKGFYDRLKKRGVLALTGMKGEDTMHCAALSIRGKVRELGSNLLPRLFEKNPYMNEIYPDAASRSALSLSSMKAAENGLTCPKSRLSVPALLLAAQRKCRRVILSQMPVSAASSAIPNVRKSASIFLRNLRSFSRKIACIAATALKSVRPEQL